MLSYRHAFHAGNFADVFKHVVLVHALDYLVKKHAPLFYLDTHAGAGCYPLNAPSAQRTGEYREGIGRLWRQPALPEALTRYLQVVRSFNAAGDLANYPGSPAIAARLLRDTDRLEFCELQRSDHASLAAAFRHDRRIRCYAEDGFRVAPGRLPPRERRGLVFIDPSYEMKDDYARAVEALLAMHRRFATGVYALWYPLVDRRRTDSLQARIAEAGVRNVLKLELLRHDHPAKPGMRGCGMFVVNPPWTLASEMAPALEVLARLLAGARGNRATVEQFSPE